MLDLKYSTYDVVFQEVPNETSLVFNVTGCPHHCEGCHSKYMWEYKGNFLKDDIYRIIDDYKDFITCVCFMGGDQNIQELVLHMSEIKKRYPGMKTCLYSGLSSEKPLQILIDNELVDYLKIGPYVKELGGLDKKTTNQRMYHLSYLDGKKQLDITHFFQKKKM